MSVLRDLRVLARYGAWADAKLFEHLAPLPEDELTKVRGAGFGSILRTLNHTYVVDLIWQANLQGKAHGFTQRNTDVLPSFAQLRDDQAAINAWYRDYTDALDEAACREVVNFHFIGGQAASLPRGDMLLHISHHKSYHRGFVAQMLYGAAFDPPMKPPTMDLPVFLRDVPESAR